MLVFKNLTETEVNSYCDDLRNSLLSAINEKVGTSVEIAIDSDSLGVNKDDPIYMGMTITIKIGRQADNVDGVPVGFPVG